MAEEEAAVEAAARDDSARQSLGLPQRRGSAGAPDWPRLAVSARPPNRPAKNSCNTRSRSQFVNGRNFFQNGTQWMDSEVQNNQAAKHIRLQFNSPEYFAFLAKNQQALPWLALGQNVQFVLDGVVYDVYE